MTLEQKQAQRVVAWRNAVALCFGLGGLLIAAWGPRLPTIKSELGVDDGTLGLLVAGGSLASLVGLSCASAIHSRLGSRRGLVLTLSLASLGVVVIGLGSSLWHSVVPVELGFLAMGFGIGTTDVMINVEGAAVEGASGKVVMPMLHAGWSAGAVIGAGIGAAASRLGVSPQWQFLVVGCLTIVAVLTAARFIPAHEVPPRSVEPVRPFGVRVRRRFAVWADPRLLAIGVVMLGVELGEGSANNWLTLGVAQGHGQPDGVAALFFTVFAASEMIFRFVSGPVVQRLGRVLTVQITAGLGVAGLLLFILDLPTWAVLLGSVLWAIGVSMGFPLGMSAAAESGPNAAAQVGVVASIGYVANLAGPPIVGFLSQGVGLLNSFWLVLTLMVVALLAARSLGE